MKAVPNAAAANMRERVAAALNSLGVDLLRTSPADRFPVLRQFAVWLIRRAAMAAGDMRDRHMYLGNISAALRMAYERDRDLAVLDEAIAVGRQVVDSQDGDIDKAMRIANLGVALRLRFEHLGELEDLDEAELWCRRAETSVPDDAPFRMTADLAVADVLIARYEWFAEKDVLDSAITLYRAAAEPRSGGHLDETAAAALSGLSVALRIRHDRFGRHDDLVEAIHYANLAVGAADDAVERALCLSDLGQALESHYESTRVLADAAEAVRTHRSAVDLIPSWHPERYVLEMNLANALRAYGQHSAGRDSVSEAIALRRAALAAMPERDRHRGNVESELATDLVSWFELTSQDSALIEALGHAKRAAELTRGTPNEAAASTSLGHVLRMMYEFHGDERYLDEALLACGKAVALVQEDDSSRPEYLANLSNVLLSSYERTGERAVLAEAIDVARLAAPDAPHRVDDPSLFSNLGNLLAIQYSISGDLDTLREGVHVCREAVAVGADWPADRPGYLGNLGVATLNLYERTGNGRDLEDAIAACREAVITCLQGDPDRPMLLHSLGNALFTRFEADLAASDAESAVEAFRQAVESCPDGHLNRPMHLAGLGMALLGWAERKSDSKVLDEAIAALDSAVRATRETDPTHANHLTNLGLALNTRGGEQDLVEARQMFRRAAENSAAAATVQIYAGMEWGDAAGAARAWPESAAAFELCVRLLPEVADSALARLDQEHRLALFPGLGASAAASALEARSPESALTVLEQARGVMLSQAFHMKSDTSVLEHISPQHARRLEELRVALSADRPAWSPGQAGSGVSASARTQADLAADDRRYRSRAQLAREREELAAEIRKLPGLERFLKPPALSRLLDQASAGPIVLLNSHHRRSDGLIITSSGVRVTRLTRLTPDSAAVMQRQFSAALRSVNDEATSEREHHQAERSIERILGQLWDDVAEPILEELGFGAAAAQQAWRPRIWWGSTGPLAQLPLHAAGHHDADGANGASVLDRAISSYTPTVEALRHARAQSATTRLPGAFERPRLLAVGMSRTPGEARLPGALREVGAVQRRFRGTTTCLLDEQATWQRVHDLLPMHSWAHFACHGIGDLREPSSGRLLLSDHLDRPFTILDVSRLRLEHAELAVLSACETTKPADQLPDEAIHITSAFQLAGFAQVIGTLWPVNDIVARRFTDHVYGILRMDGGHSPDGAMATHASTLALRDRYRSHPSLWSPFVHVGR